jgi:hypothetical protein
MLVRLWKKGDLRPRKKYNERYVNIPIAFHCPISHILGEPCIVILPKPKSRRYPLVHEKNVIQVINHESLHCAITDLGLDTDEIGEKDFDSLLRRHKGLTHTNLF